MTAVIELDLDQPDTEATPAEPAVLPFPIWAQTWASRHPARAGTAIGCIITAAAAIVVLTTLVVRWWPPDPPAVSNTHAFAVHTTGDEVTTAIRRGDVMSRGEILGSEPFAMDDVTSMAVTVYGPAARCRIVVDGQVADEASVIGQAASVTCLWTAPRS